MLKTRLMSAVGVSLVLAMALTSCSEGTAPPKTDSVSTTFVAVYPAVAENIDPNIYQGDPSRRFGFERGGGLFTYDTSSLDGNGCKQMATNEELSGDLAESWKYSETDGAYIVKLRNAKSQFGNELTSADVKYTYDRAIATPGISAGQLAMIHPAKELIQVVDDKTFKIKVDSPTSVDLSTMTWESFGIIDKKAAQEHATTSDPWSLEWLSKNTASFGPWSVAEADFQPGVQITLHQNENYWGKKGVVKTLIMRAVPDSGTRTQLLQTGEAQYADTLSYDQLSQISKDPAVQIVKCVSANRDVIVMNTTDAVVGNQLVRQAISLAIDRKQLVDGPYRGLATAAKTGLSAAFPQSKSDELSYNPEKAKSLLAEAGYANGTTLTLSYSPTRPGPEAEQTAVLIKTQLEKIGITVNLDPIASSADFQQSTAGGKLQMWLNVLPPAVADVAYTGGLYYVTKGSQNTSKFSNKEVDSVVASLNDPAQIAKRKDLSGELAGLLVKEMPVVPLVDRSFIKALSSKYTGIANQPNGELFISTLTGK